MCGMIPTPPITLHLSRLDFTDTMCNGGDMRVAFYTLDAAEGAIRNKPDRYEVCGECRGRRQAAKEDGR